MQVPHRVAAFLVLGSVWLVGLPAAASASFFSADSIQRLAPEVIFHRDEEFHPTSGKDFLDHAGLAFSYDNGCGAFYQHRRVKAGRVNRWSDAEVAALGNGDFVARLRSSKDTGCRALPGPENAFSTSDLTRPRQGGRDNRLQDRDGWYLDLANDRRAGFPDTVPHDDQYETKAPTYFDDGLLYSNGRPTGFAFVTYWFFYAYDDGPTKQNHEGDWEDISIRLEHAGGERWRPVEVFYAKHDKESDVLPWDRAYQVEAGGTTRLGVFSARGTHASYGGGVSPLRSLDHIDEEGPAWATWKGLRFLWDQGWDGYCGAWGSVGRFGFTTGPLGPGCLDGTGHPVKSGRPKAWGTSKAAAGGVGGNSITLKLEAAAPQPVADRDGDGVPDRADRCPTQAGTRADGCPNPAPVAADQQFTFAVNGGPGKVTYVKRLSASDDSGTIDSWLLDYQSFGSASQNFRWNGDGTFAMKPEAKAGATLLLRFHVLDGEGAASNPATVTIHVCQEGTAYPCP